MKGASTYFRQKKEEAKNPSVGKGEGRGLLLSRSTITPKGGGRRTLLSGVGNHSPTAHRSFSGPDPISFPQKKEKRKRILVGVSSGYGNGEGNWTYSDHWGRVYVKGGKGEDTFSVKGEGKTLPVGSR